MAAILLVDDDDLLRSLVGMFLDTAGHVCSEAVSVAQARAWLATKKFDLVLSDFNMPRESGLVLLRHVLGEYPGTPFIMITGETNPAVRREALDSGVYECILKPFRMWGLLKIVTQALSKGSTQGPRELVRRPLTLPVTSRPNKAVASSSGGSREVCGF
jgi:two-component system, OmpR family, phosphate regulon response regulator OmpR